MSFETLVDGIDFGEGPRWHDGRLWYSDFYHHTVYAVTADGHREAMVEVPNQPSGLGWMPDGRMLIVSMLDRKVMVWDGTTLDEHADLSSVATFHCNDMVVDSAGRAYVGNFGFDLHSLIPGDDMTMATMAIVEPDGSVRAGAGDLAFPNGCVITPDDKTLIVGQSMNGKYEAFDLDADGSMTNRRLWAEIPRSAPDGCTLDAAGGIWFADARGNRVVRVVEGGEITNTMGLDQGTYACMLGGDDGRTLFVLTAASAGPEAAGAGTGAIHYTRVEHAAAGRP